MKLTFFRPDVWFVTTTQALQWITDPKKIKELNSFDAWDCRKQTTSTVKPCFSGNKCGVPHKVENITDTRYMETCRDCPKVRKSKFILRLLFQTIF